jgi:hypothetical protein
MVMAMADFSFRISLVLPQREGFQGDQPILTLDVPGFPRTATLTASGASTIAEATDLSLVSSGWPTEEAARYAGENMRQALMLSLARLGTGADFGARARQGGFTEAGLQWIKQMFGAERVLQHVHGLMVFETNPEPRFVSMRANGKRLMQPERLVRVLAYAVEHPRELSDKERLSLDLYNASFFAHSAEARLITLAMAVEALLDPQPRPEAAINHVDRMIAETEHVPGLGGSERASLLGSLRWMRQESINQAGRRLARERLGEREYMGRAAPEFFSFFYDLRSRLVHGVHPAPSQAEIDATAAGIEVFVSHLLSGPLLAVEFGT